MAGAEPSLAAFAAYFLRLGTFGFGGPIALAGYMQRDLVEARRWVTKDEYVKGLALAQLAPGPLAAQLAIYLGWARAGVFGEPLNHPCCGVCVNQAAVERTRKQTADARL